MKTAERSGGTAAAGRVHPQLSPASSAEAGTRVLTQVTASRREALRERLAGRPADGPERFAAYLRRCNATAAPAVGRPGAATG